MLFRPWRPDLDPLASSHQRLGIDRTGNIGSFATHDYVPSLMGRGIDVVGLKRNVPERRPGVHHGRASYEDERPPVQRKIYREYLRRDNHASPEHLGQARTPCFRSPYFSCQKAVLLVNQETLGRSTRVVPWRERPCLSTATPGP